MREWKWFFFSQRKNNSRQWTLTHFLFYFFFRVFILSKIKRPLTSYLCTYFHLALTQLINFTDSAFVFNSKQNHTRMIISEPYTLTFLSALASLSFCTHNFNYFYAINLFLAVNDWFHARMSCWLKNWRSKKRKCFLLKWVTLKLKI